MNRTPFYSLQRVRKSFTTPAGEVSVFQPFSLDIEAGQTYAVVGASGSGKSTFLHILASLEEPSDGRVLYCGQDMKLWSSKEKARFRNHEIGLVFQFHYLLPEFSVLENVAMPGIIDGMSMKAARKKACVALERVGMQDFAERRVQTLSGGEMQRVSIARAVFRRPRVLLADEPTGNLDEKNGEKVAEVLLDLNATMDTTLLVVTHNLELARQMQWCLRLRSGILSCQES